MPDSSAHRAYRPVICIGYGTDGVHWLQRVALSAQRVPAIANLISRGVIQFWAVGESAPEGTFWWTLGADEHCDRVLDRLDISRRNQLRFEVPGLELQRVMVLERVRLYDEAADQRTQVRRSLEAARLHASGGGGAATDQGSQAFEYDWFALVDGTWPRGRPDAVLEGRASNVIKDLDAKRVFYIDQYSDARGVIGSDEADQVLAQFAVAMLSSDLGFPRPNAGDEGRSSTTERPAAVGMVTPISMMTLVHGREQFVRLRAQVLLWQLLRGPTDDVPHLLEPIIGQAPSLAAALELELKDLESGASALNARRRRVDAIRAIIARHLAELSPRDGLVAVNRLRGAITRHRQLGASPLVATGMSASAVIPVSGSLGVTATIIGLAALGGISWFLRRRAVSRARDEIVIEPVNEQLELERERALKEWDRVADGLEGLFNDFASYLDRWDSGVPAAAEPWKRGDLPYHWQLAGSPVDSDRKKAPEWLYETLAGVVAEHLTRPATRTNSAGMFDQSLRSVAEREFADGKRTVSEQLRPLLEAPQNHTVIDAVRAMTPLVHLTEITRIQEIVWLAPNGAAYGDAVIQLERPVDQSWAHVLLSEDHNQTTRIAFGDDVPWRSVGSLGYLPHTLDELS